MPSKPAPVPDFADDAVAPDFADDAVAPDFGDESPVAAPQGLERRYAAEVLGAIPAAAASLGSAVASFPETQARLYSGVIGAVAGEEAGAAFKQASRFIPSVAIGSWLDEHVIDPAQKWYQEETAFGQIEVAQAKVPWTEKLTDPTYVLRNIAAQAPQMALSMGAAGLAGKGVSLAGQAILPSVLQIGEISENLRAHEAQNGPIGDLGFGLAAFGGGMVGGVFELAGAKGLMGQLVKFAPKQLGSVLATRAAGAAAEGLLEGFTESAQNAVSNFSELLAKDPPKTVEELLTKTTTPTFWGEVFKGTGESFSLGAAIGLPISSVHAVSEGRVEARQERVIEALKKNMDDPTWALAKPASTPGKIDQTLPVRQEEEVKAYFKEQLPNLSESEFEANWTIYQRAANVWRNWTGYDKSHWWGALLTETPDGLPSVRSLHQQTQRGELVATHNMKLEAVDLFLQLEGRVPGLSIAVQRPDMKREKGSLLTQPGFGPITLVFNPDAIDPLQHDDIVAFDRDFYSPTAGELHRSGVSWKAYGLPGQYESKTEAAEALTKWSLGSQLGLSVDEVLALTPKEVAERFLKEYPEQLEQRRGEMVDRDAEPELVVWATEMDRIQGADEDALDNGSRPTFERVPGGAFIDATGKPLTPESLAAKYPKTKVAQGPVKNMMAQRLGSLDEMRARAKEGLVSEKDDRANWEKAAAIEEDALFDVASAVQTSFRGVMTEGEARSVAGRVVNRILPQLALDTGGTEINEARVQGAVRQAVENLVSRKKISGAVGTRLLLDPKLRDTVHRVALESARKLRALPSDYFEVKRYNPIEPKDVAAMIVDATEMDDGTIAKLQGMAERFGWDFRMGGMKVRPDSTFTDAREEMIFQFADRFFQRSGSQIKGTTEVFRDGRMLLKFFEGADVSTMLHEGAHVFRRQLYAMERLAPPEAKAAIQSGLKTLETWAGVTDSQWTVEAEEKFATATEQYLRSGKAPIPKLQRLFEQFKTWLRSIYDDVQAKELATFSPEMEEFFNEFVLDVPGQSETLKTAAKMNQMKREDRLAYETALALRDIPAAKAKLQEHFDRMAAWVDLAKDERQLLGEQNEEREDIKDEFRQLRLHDAQAEAAMHRGDELASRIAEMLELPDRPKTAALMTDPKVFDGWRAQLREQGKKKGFGQAYLKRVAKLLEWMKVEAEVLQVAFEYEKDAAAAAQRTAAGFQDKQSQLMRKRAQVRLLVRELRKVTGEVLSSPKEERAKVLEMADRFYASPRALGEWINRTIGPALELHAKAIAQAEATYRTTIEAIASRGQPAQSWGRNPVEDAQTLLLNERIRKDVAAAQAVLKETSGLDIVFSGTGTDPADVLNDLIVQVHRGMDLPGGLDETQQSLVDREATLLMNGLADATVIDSAKRFSTPWGAVSENFKNLVVGVRSLGQAMVSGQLAFNPMKALDPYTYDPNRPMNKLWRFMGIPVVKPLALTDAQIKVAQDAFVGMDGSKGYYEKVTSRNLVAAIYSAFPTLKERQFLTMARDFGSTNIAALEEKYRNLSDMAMRELAEAQKSGNREAIAAAKEKSTEAHRRWQRAKGHVGMRSGGLSPRMAYVLKQVEGAFDALGNAAISAGLWGPDAVREDYFPRIYRKEDVERIQRFFRNSTMVGGPNKHGFKRVFETLIEAYIVEGIKPATLDAAFLIDNYGRSLVDSIEKRRLVKKLESISPDLFVWMDSARNLPPPDFVDVTPYLSHSLVPSDGTSPTSRLFAHKVVAIPLASIAEASAFNKNDVLNMAKKVNGWLKRIQLAIDLYHLWQVTRIATASGIYGPGKHVGLPFRSVLGALGMLDPAHEKHPLVRELMMQGLQVSAGDWARREIHKEVEAQVLDKISKGAKLYHWLGEHGEVMGKYMWERYVPALKILVATHQLERLLANPNTKDMPREVLVRAAATVTNDKFGGMAPSLKGRSETMKDLMTIGFLAPDWLETRFRNVLGVVKKGPEGELWREYWAGEGIMDLVRKQGGGEPGRWATGYVFQGMLLTAAANAMLVGLGALGKGWWDKDEEEEAKKERGWNWFTGIVVPSQDRRGAPLHISFFATADYFKAFLSDVSSVAPLQRWYLGRQGPLLRSARELASGKDFAGRPFRPGFFSMETVGNLLDNALPWFNNIVYGSVGDAGSGQDFGFSASRSIARLFGGHTSSSYLPAVQERMDYFVGTARLWNRESAWRWEKWYYKQPVVGDMLRSIAKAKAEHHNAEVRAFIAKVQKTPEMQRTLGRFMSKMDDAFMALPGEVR